MRLVQMLVPFFTSIHHMPPHTRSPTGSFGPLRSRAPIFEDGVPLFVEPQLVKTKELGNKLTELIGPKRAAFLRGHGVAVIGIDIEEALYSSLILENDARMAMRASPLGELNSFSPEDCRIFGAKGSWPRWSSLAWAYFEQVEARWDRQPGTVSGPSRKAKLGK
jgi:hypothetical protein